jgi:predicted metalloprotease with PDZ domain
MNARVRLLAPRQALARCVLFVALLTCAPCAAQDSPAASAARAYRVGYTLAMPEPASHLFEVRVEVDGLAGAEHVDFQMPRWSPGRYAVYEFAKNVQGARAARLCPPRAKCEAAALAVARLDTQTWRVRTEGAGGVSFSYKVYADDLSGTFSQLDERHANFNGASVFVYVVGHKQDPVALRIEAPRGWRVVNGYATRDTQNEFSFPDYDTLIDTPTEVAPDFQVETFDVDGKTYRVVAHSLVSDGGRLKALAESIRRVVRAQVALMGAPEFEQYTFLFHFDPTAPRGDGMEHLNSTQIVERGALSSDSTFADALDTAAHEFFHVWNVKRLRPQGLGPWDFTRPVVTRGLWIAEGFTNYYGRLSQRRAGLLTDGQLLDGYSDTVSRVEGAPGSRVMSAEESSLLASFIDRAAHQQSTNFPAVSVSYYPKGETLALALDLLLRARTRGRASLDDVMRRAYREFYLESRKDSYYLRGRAYTVEEFERVASAAAGFDLSDFFARHVRGVEPPPYEEGLAAHGLRFADAPREPSGRRATYRIEEDKNAAPEARALREAWLKGKAVAGRQ